MNQLLSNERSKWILAIGLIAIIAAFTAKNVVSYPNECVPYQPVEISEK